MHIIFRLISDESGFLAFTSASTCEHDLARQALTRLREE